MDHSCYFCRVFVMLFCAPVYCCLVVTCWEGLTSWLSFVVSNCEFVTFPLVPWVRCGTSLYRFLIFALFFTYAMLFFLCLMENRTLHILIEFTRMLAIIALSIARVSVNATLKHIVVYYYYSFSPAPIPLDGDPATLMAI